MRRGPVDSPDKRDVRGRYGVNARHLDPSDGAPQQHVHRLVLSGGAMRRVRDVPPDSGPRVTPVAVRLDATATVRLDQDVIARVDAIAAARSTTWHRVTRAEVLRDLIDLGLPLSERRVRPRARNRHHE
jgi:hypothetical protein